MRNKILFLLCLLFLLSCGNSNKKKASDVQSFIGKTIRIPDDLICRSAGRDTTLSLNKDNPYRLLVYFSTTSCSSCNMKSLLDWKQFMRLCDSVFPPERLKFVYVFNIHQRATDMDYDLKSYKFDVPVYYDKKGNFEKVNNLPTNNLFHTMLLDKDNRVLIVGSPFHSKKMVELYKNTIIK